MNEHAERAAKKQWDWVARLLDLALHITSRQNELMRFVYLSGFRRGYAFRGQRRDDKGRFCT